MRLAIILLTAIAVLVGTATPPAIASRVTEKPVLPRPAILKGLFAGQLHMVADYFWLLTINRVGTARTTKEHQAIYWYADLVTDLDPGFELVYPFSAVVIPVPDEEGRYVNVKEADALLRKGANHHPGNRKILFHLAYNLMFYEGKYTEAAEILLELSRDPTAPEWYSSLATRLFAAGGDLETSEYVTRSLLAQCSDDTSCEIYERRLIEIQQERLLREIDAAALRFQEKHDRLPAAITELVENGFLPGWPQDPLEGEIFLDESGRARSTATKHRLELILMENRGASAPAPTTP